MSDEKFLDALRLVLCKLLSGHRPKRVRFDWTIGPVTTKPSANPKVPMDIRLTNEQKVKVTLTPKTDTGKPAKLDGKPTWEVIDGGSTVEPSDDGLSAVIISGDDPGDTQIMLKADADIGEGTEEISEILKVSVVGASATNLGISVGTPEPK